VAGNFPGPSLNDQIGDAGKEGGQPGEKELVGFCGILLAG
jgi:hypothetical protein